MKLLLFDFRSWHTIQSCNRHGSGDCFHNTVLILVSIAVIFQIFLKVAEESGVDAETSGNFRGLYVVHLSLPVLCPALSVVLLHSFT